MGFYFAMEHIIYFDRSLAIQSSYSTIELERLHFVASAFLPTRRTEWAHRESPKHSAHEKALSRRRRSPTGGFGVLIELRGEVS